MLPTPARQALADAPPAARTLPPTLALARGVPRIRFPLMLVVLAGARLPVFGQEGFGSEDGLRKADRAAEANDESRVRPCVSVQRRPGRFEQGRSLAGGQQRLNGCLFHRKKLLPLTPTGTVPVRMSSESCRLLRWNSLTPELGAGIPSAGALSHTPEPASTSEYDASQPAT